MPLSQREKWLIAGNLLFILAAGALRSALALIPGAFVFHDILSMAYLTVVFEWTFSIRRRFPQQTMQSLLLAAAALMSFWIFVRFVKYDIAPAGTALNRWLWYSYYIPIVLIPLQFFLATLYVGKTDRSDISGRWMLLYIPAVLLICGILTNDLHQQAFRFQPGFAHWNSRYTYGPLYYAAVGAAAACIAGSLFQILRTCVRRHLLRRFLLPAAVLGVGAAYFLLYSAVYSEKSLLQLGWELPEFTILLLIGFWECLVLTHLIPSNRRHEDFFRESSIRAGLTDNDFQVQIQGAADPLPPIEEIRASARGPFLLADGDTLLKSHPVPGGHFYWTEDIAEQKRLNRALEETADLLAEEHAMLAQTTALEESRSRTAQKNLLYDRIGQSIQGQLGEATGILAHLPEDEEDFRTAMRYAGVLGAYIKRRSNLLLLAGEGQAISSDELGLSIRESLAYVQLLDIPCRAQIADGLTLPAGLALFLYELYEAALEAALPDPRGVLISLRLEKQTLIFYLETDDPADMPDTRRFEKPVRRFGGTLHAQIEDRTGTVIFRMAYQQTGTGGETP